jgi:hypothetical protein
MLFAQPVAQLPQPSDSTSLAHVVSHAVVQQYGSAAHTHDSTDGSSQPGTPPALVQQYAGSSHTPQPSDSTSLTHRPSHAVVQQYESTAHTQAWTVVSLQPGPLSVVQQSPADTGVGSGPA